MTQQPVIWQQWVLSATEKARDSFVPQLFDMLKKSLLAFLPTSPPRP